MTTVEKIFLNDQPLQYKGEKIGVLVTANAQQLGEVTALRFLEWHRNHPDGVISLPTGNSPLPFIRETQRLLNTWNTKETQQKLNHFGLTHSRPRLDGIRFVQMDEFYPINSSQTNSFLYFVKKHYFEGIGFSPERALTIDGSTIGLSSTETLESIWQNKPVDLSLRDRQPTTRLERRQKDLILSVDEWCMQYEESIRSMDGGIAFFLGGIGPDGHIAFNTEGSNFFSTTRLCPLNYETKAAAANDLGGIETANRCHAITIGIGTIRHNPNVTPIIIASGAAKAVKIAETLLNEKSIRTPGTFLHDIPTARVYLTTGSAQHLTSRAMLRMKQTKKVTKQDLEKIIIDTALAQGKQINALTQDDFSHIPIKEFLHVSGSSLQKTLQEIERRLIENIQRGVHPQKNQTLFHSEPHHDDIMLGYLPYVVRNVREHSNSHHFASMTYGFRAVTNAYMLDLCEELKTHLKDKTLSSHIRKYLENYDKKDRGGVQVLDYLDGIASFSKEKRKIALLSRLYTILTEIFDETLPEGLSARLEELINYFATQYPGKEDLPHIQVLKGRCREWESECLWGYFGFDKSSLTHTNMRFVDENGIPSKELFQKNVEFVLSLLTQVNPSIITLAFDPEESAPAAHHETLKIYAAAIEQYADKTRQKEIRILGYRNVWFQFHPSEANIFVPVSLNMFALQHTSFMSSYMSQKDASFPSPRFQGPFSLATQKAQVQQYEMIKTCLGESFFFSHPSAFIRATRGLIYLKEMDVNGFLNEMKPANK